MVSLFLSCADDMGVEGVLPGGDAQQKGEMVRFAAGTTTNQVNSRAGSGLNETPGTTYYMPEDYRFVCRMYYIAATGSDKFDTQGCTDITTWLKVEKDKGNSLYWRNTFLPTDNVDIYGNDAQATCLYWQNRKPHVFLAWTDLNRAKTIGYSPNKGSGSLKFVPADVDYVKRSGEKTEQYVIAGYEIYGVNREFANWAELRDFITDGTNYENLIKNKVPAGVDPSQLIKYYYDYGWSCKYSKDLAVDSLIDAVYKKYGWIQYQMFYDKLEYTGDKTGADIQVVKNEKTDYPAYLYNTATNKYLCEVESCIYQTDAEGNLLEPHQTYTPVVGDSVVRTGESPSLRSLLDGDVIVNSEGVKVAQCVWNYYLTDQYGNVRYDETRPRYTFYFKELYEKKEQESVTIHPANAFDLTRRPLKDAEGNPVTDAKGNATYQLNSITEQPDICQALTKVAPLGATQSANRVNLYFKHQFSQVQVNLKSSADLSVVIDKENIQKVELLGVTDTAYVFTEIDEDGKVEPTTYKTVDISHYTDAQLQQNQYGTSFEMFDMYDAEAGADKNWGYPTGYLKSYNALTFGQLQAIRITWNEERDGSGIKHEATYIVSNEDLKNLKSGYKYIWNIELRRGTLAIIRTEIVDWIVPADDLEYNTDGTIFN